jgi:hypothetical protein
MGGPAINELHRDFADDDTKPATTEHRRRPVTRVICPCALRYLRRSSLTSRAARLSHEECHEDGFNLVRYAVVEATYRVVASSNALSTSRGIRPRGLAVYPFSVAQARTADVLVPALAFVLRGFLAQRLRGR